MRDYHKKLNCIRDSLGLDILTPNESHAGTHVGNKDKVSSNFNATDYSRMFIPTTPQPKPDNVIEKPNVLPGQMDFRDKTELCTQCKAADKKGSLRCRYYDKASFENRCMFLKHEQFCDYSPDYSCVK